MLASAAPCSAGSRSPWPPRALDLGQRLLIHRRHQHLVRVGVVCRDACHHVRDDQALEVLLVSGRTRWRECRPRNARAGRSCRSSPSAWRTCSTSSTKRGSSQSPARPAGRCRTSPAGRSSSTRCPPRESSCRTPRRYSWVAAGPPCSRSTFMVGIVADAFRPDVESPFGVSIGIIFTPPLRTSSRPALSKYVETGAAAATAVPFAGAAGAHPCSSSTCSDDEGLGRRRTSPSSTQGPPYITSRPASGIFAWGRTTSSLHRHDHPVADRHQRRNPPRAGGDRRVNSRTPSVSADRSLGRRSSPPEHVVDDQHAAGPQLLLDHRQRRGIAVLVDVVEDQVEGAIGLAAASATASPT